MAEYNMYPHWVCGIKKVTRNVSQVKDRGGDLVSFGLQNFVYS